MRVFSLGFAVLAALATSLPAASQPSPAASEDSTAVADLVVRAAPLRPESEVPRFSPAQINQLAVFSRDRFNAALRSEGRAERGRVSIHGGANNPTDGGGAMFTTMNPTVGPNESFGTMDSAIQIMGVTGAADGRRRQLYRQLQRAAEAAEKATVAAETAFADWAAGRRTREQLMAAERARETAVKAMLTARDEVDKGVEAAESQQWASVALLNDASDRTGQNARAQVGELISGPVGGDAAASGFVTYVQPRVGLSRADQEAVFTAMERREYRLAAEAATKTLKFEDVAATRVSNDMVRVSGQITNTADVAAPIPPFNVVFYDQNNKIFAGAVVQPDTRGAPPNGKRRFSFDVAAAGGARISRVAVIFGQTAVPLATASR